MDYNEYQELTNLIDVYLETGSCKILAGIQNCIETKEGCREKLMEDLIERNERYIQVFSNYDQVKIVSDLADQIKQREYLAYRVSWMLPYVSDEALDQIISNIDNIALIKIMHNIKEHIRIIGNRFCDSSTYFWINSTNIVSRMGERMVWHKIYRKCRRNLKR